jgi:uncharacterized protein
VIVVSDASPLTNLAAVGRVELLREIYGRVLIPSGVADELREGERRGAHSPILPAADWLEVHEVVDKSAARQLLLEIDWGEAEAIVLAMEKHADLLLMDERLGRRVAARKGIRTVGLLGSLIVAKEKGSIEAVRPILDDLIEIAGFWVDRQLYSDVLRQAGELS